MTAAACLACGGADLVHLVDLGRSPVLCGVFWPGTQDARAAGMGRMDLAGCRACGHVQNAAFDETLVDYDAEYDISLHFSTTFRTFSDALAERLARTYTPAGGHVVEIGSGKGEFLVDLCGRTGATGTGYDPSYAGESTSDAVTFEQRYFPVGAEPPPFDLLVARHVLEHLVDPGAFLTGLAAALAGTGGAAYLEMPSAEFNFSPEGLWDCIYPHVSYFATTSLLAAVERAGLDVLRIERGFHGQFLGVDVAAPGSSLPRGDVPGPAERDRLLAAHLGTTAAFAERSRAAVTTWRSRLAELAATGEVAMWGAGMKAVTFLNVVDPGDRLAALVDLNPRKWGRHVPGTAHRVDAPGSLAGRDLAAVLVTNPAYSAEVAAELERMGVGAPVLEV